MFKDFARQKQQIKEIIIFNNNDHYVYCYNCIIILSNAPQSI